MNPHASRGLIRYAQQSGRRRGQLDNPIVDEGPTVVDSKLDGFSVVEIGDARHGGQRQGLMRCGDGVLVVWLATRGDEAGATRRIDGCAPRLVLAVGYRPSIPDGLALIW